MANWITDRTSADVSNGTDKGHYNYEDLNRVSEACYELKELMAGVGFSADFDLSREWEMKDYPTKEATQAYLDNVYKVINSFYSYQQYDLPEDMTAFTYTQANDIEKALSDIERLVAAIKTVFIKSGTLQAGGMVIR